MQVLVVEPHEGQLDAGEFALGDIRLGGAEAEFADLLPVRIGGRALADARNLQDLGAQVVLRQGTTGEAGAERRTGGQRRGAFHEAAAVGLHGHNAVVEFEFHVCSPSKRRFQRRCRLRAGARWE